MQEINSQSKRSRGKRLWELWQNYSGEVVFGIFFFALMVVCHWLSRYIQGAFYDHFLAPIQTALSAGICFMSAFVLFRRSDGMRFRKMWGWTMVLWGLGEIFMLLQNYFQENSMLLPGSDVPQTFAYLIGNVLGWALLLYPTETLRPGWMNGKIGTLQLLPMVALWALDYVVPYDLRWLLALYPLLLTVLMLTHIRAYRIWCEQNYSSMDNIDVQWIVRYLIMLAVFGLSYMYIMATDNPTRIFTQNVLAQFFFIYATEQILFRKDPWRGMSEGADSEEAKSEESTLSTVKDDANAELLEQWMQEKKPYLNPDFKLMDLRAVLPMNRTYLSQFINDTYGFSFYQFANIYRLEEAQRLMRQNLDMKLSEVASRAGFSSQASFSHIFTKEMGVTPREWAKKNG